MVKHLLYFASLLFCLVGTSFQTCAQGVTYTSVQAGLWTDPTTWQVNDPSGTAAKFPATNADNIVSVNHAVTLNIEYAVSGESGVLTIAASGSLVHNDRYTLTVGQQEGKQTRRLVILPRSEANGLAMNLYKLVFIKAQGLIEAPIEMASCVTFDINTDLEVTSSITIRGNLFVDQGNSSVNRDTTPAGTLTVNGQLDVPANFERNFRFAAMPTVLGTIFSCNALAPLPVELVSFSARFENKQVTLRWATASEKDAASFTVERSVDGKKFSAVTTVKAAGNSNTRREYLATDRSMPKGLNYYRLKQTDFDGTSTYTQVLSVQVEEGGLARLEAYGSNGSLSVEVETPGNLQQLRVLDMMGRVLYTENVQDDATGFITRQIPITGATSRQVYIIQAVTSQGVLNQKVLVAE